MWVYCKKHKAIKDWHIGLPQLGCGCSFTKEDAEKWRIRKITSWALPDGTILKKSSEKRRIVIEQKWEIDEEAS